MNNRDKGREYEEKAARWLESRGHEIIERNFYTPAGELDIISLLGGRIFFSEVKYRKDLSFGSPEEAVGRLKQLRMKRAARYYLMETYRYMDCETEFLMIAVNDTRIRVYRNAF
ncbi:MAG: YraN family protein [Lachnospiraceae bacterium]|nr:YraN family protein [Lachnospiraceae bacterium]